MRFRNLQSFTLMFVVLFLLLSVLSACGDNTAISTATATAAISTTAATTRGATTTATGITTAVTTSAATTTAAGTTTAVAPTGKLTVAVRALPEDLNPISPNGGLGVSPQIYVLGAYLDTITLMEGSKVVPALAVSWKALDSLTWEFKLRKGVKFHNGEAFDSGSIKATFDAFFTQRTEPFVRLRTVDKNGYSAPDPETFIIKTTTPDGILPAKLSQVIVLPAKYYAEKGIDGFKAAPVGTGPFQFASYERDKQISFKAFSGSWSGTPKIADLTFKLIPDVATQVQALKAGEVDLIALSTKDQYDDLKAKGFKVYNTLIGSTTVVDLKTIDGGPLADKRVRQALNLAINKTELTQGIFGDLTEAATQTFSPQAFGYNPEIKPDSYDPEKARALLKEAGIKEGELNLSIPYLSGRVGGKETLEALTQYLAKVGIKVEAQPLESATYFAKYQKNELAPAAIIARVYAPQLDGLLAVEWFTKDFGSLQRYNNDTLNTLYRQALGEPDNTKREALVKQASRLLVEDYASIPLYYGFEIFATSTKVEGFKPSSNGYLILDKVTKTS